MLQTGFRKGRGARDQIVNIHWILEKARKFQKNIYVRFINHTKVFDCVDHNKLCKALKELTCLLRNCMWVKKQVTRPFYLSPEKLHVGQEATVRILYGATD